MVYYIQIATDQIIKQNEINTKTQSLFFFYIFIKAISLTKFKQHENYIFKFWLPEKVPLNVQNYICRSYFYGRI